MGRTTRYLLPAARQSRRRGARLPRVGERLTDRVGPSDSPLMRGLLFWQRTARPCAVDGREDVRAYGVRKGR